MNEFIQDREKLYQEFDQDALIWLSKTDEETRSYRLIHYHNKHAWTLIIAVLDNLPELLPSRIPSRISVCSFSRSANIKRENETISLSGRTASTQPLSGRTFTATIYLIRDIILGITKIKHRNEEDLSKAIIEFRRKRAAIIELLGSDMDKEKKHLYSFKL